MNKTAGTSQEALDKLKYLDIWIKSIEEMRAKIRREHGDLNQLLSRAETLWPEDGGDSSDISLNPKRNKEAEILWNLYDEVHDIGAKFISAEIGLSPSSWFHHPFLDYWIHSVIPELTEDYDPEYYSEEYFLDRERVNVWYSSRVVRRQGKTQIIDSISWYRDKVGPRDIAEKLPDIKWPTAPPRKLWCLSRLESAAEPYQAP